MEKKFFFLVFVILMVISKAQAQGNVLSGDISFPSTEKLQRYLNLDLFYTHDFISNTGGVKAGPRNIGALEIYLETDFRKYTGLNGEIQAHYLHINSHDNRGEIGDMQYVSNIDAPTQVDRMADLWYQHHFSKKLKILAGIHDISTDFNVTKSAANFLNSSFFISSEFVYAGPNGASVYPVTAVGARAIYKLTDEIEILTGAYDADPGGEETYRSFHSRISNNEGYLLITEVDHILENQKIGLAAWANTKYQVKEQDETNEAASYGFYSMFERDLNHNLSAFVRYGWASPIVNPIQSNISGGFLYKGILQRKKNLDEAGLAFTQIHISSYHRDVLARENDSTTRSKETTYELYYNFLAFDYFNFRPDIQYIQHPSGVVKNKDALALGLRTIFEL